MLMGSFILTNKYDDVRYRKIKANVIGHQIRADYGLTLPRHIGRSTGARFMPSRLRHLCFDPMSGCPTPDWKEDPFIRSDLEEYLLMKVAMKRQMEVIGTNKHIG
jgi:hypothetical protein